MFEPEVFRKQMYCIEESTCNIVGTIRRPHGDSAPGESCPPSLRLWSLVPFITSVPRAGRILFLYVFDNLVQKLIS